MRVEGAVLSFRSSCDCCVLFFDFAVRRDGNCGVLHTLFTLEMEPGGEPSARFESSEPTELTSDRGVRSDDFDHGEVLVSGEVELRQCLKTHRTDLISDTSVWKWRNSKRNVCVNVTLVSFLCPPARSFMTTMLGLATFSIRFTC